MFFSRITTLILDVSHESDKDDTSGSEKDCDNNVGNFSRLIEHTKKHFLVKLHETPTRCFKVIDNFHSQKY